MLESYKHFREMTNENQKLYQLTDQDLQDIQQCLLGILQDIDQYCADHRISNNEKFHYLLGLVDASMSVNAVLEPLVPTNIKEEPQ